jgi:hypothetical protein
MAVLTTYLESLQAHNSSEPFLENMQALTIFSNWSFRVQMKISSTYPGSLQKIESNEPIFIDMRGVSIFNSAYF